MSDAAIEQGGNKPEERASLSVEQKKSSAYGTLHNNNATCRRGR